MTPVSDKVKPMIYVVIATLNNDATIDEQVKALIHQDCSVSYEIIIAYNGSLCRYSQ
jgi:glycosyltransferase involved in cell wall biosynthesis